MDRLRKKCQERYKRIPDSFKSLEEVQKALRRAGLDSTNVIIGIDYTSSNQWLGKDSFGGKNLHAVGDQMNPYEEALTIIGKTLEVFEEDKEVLCFGFGDATTSDFAVFHFNADGSPCLSFEDAISRYRQITPHVKLAGPTSFAPIIEAAVKIVEESGGQFHVLVIIADGQMTRPSDTPQSELSAQEKSTVEAIVGASNYALSIVLIGVGDGPWEAMYYFDDNIKQRNFDNFQFVDFNSIMSRPVSQESKQTTFALAALMEIPFQYQAALDLGISGRYIGRIPPLKPLPPPPTVSAADAKTFTEQGSVISLGSNQSLGQSSGRYTNSRR